MAGSGLFGLAAATGGMAPLAMAADEVPAGVYPIYAHQPNAPFNDLAQRTLAGAAKRRRLSPLEVIDIDAPPVPRVAEPIKLAKDQVRKLAFEQALRPLEDAAAIVAATGGAGLSTAELSDLYLFRGMTVARADWKPARSTDAVTQARAYADYLRAATLTPTRALNPRETPPPVMDDWQRALDEVRARPRGVLTVRGPADATIAFDGDAAAPLGAGATYQNVVYGEHLVHVEEVGYPPWGTVVKVDRPAQEVIVPARPALVLDDQVAAAHARRMGARFALVGEVKLGTPPPLQLQLRLVDATGLTHDTAMVPLPAEPGTIDAAVMRLDDEAVRIEHLGLAPTVGVEGPPGAGPSPESPAVPPPPLLAPAPATQPGSAREDWSGWAHQHWPALVGLGALITATLILGVAASGSR
ncbi:MAG TPA: hypothetical protein VNO55_18990 [Polyangia bacterium]|nr:hypothetical protein [Polyangia bacterium]